MITQLNVLLKEMLFLGSILIIIIVTNLAWESLSQDLVPLITQQQYILPRDIARNPFSLANVVPKLSQDVYLAKGSGGTPTTLRYSFHLFSVAS